jgi:predicted GIY-YIG superfamily endonuclease
MRRNNYRKRNHFVYVLRLQDGKKYVGRTSNLRQCLNQHFSGDGSEWTKRYSPISVEYT